VSIPLVLTRTSPAVVDLDVPAVGRSALLNIASPTGFLAPLLPSQLWKAVHEDMAVDLILVVAWQGEDIEKCCFLLGCSL
jgi:hypothetical protein